MITGLYYNYDGSNDLSQNLRNLITPSSKVNFDYQPTQINMKIIKLITKQTAILKLLMSCKLTITHCRYNLMKHKCSISAPPPAMSGKQIKTRHYVIKSAQISEVLS